MFYVAVWNKRLVSELSTPAYLGLRVHDTPVYTVGLLTTDSTEPDEIPGVSPLSLAGRR